MGRDLPIKAGTNNVKVSLANLLLAGLSVVLGLPPRASKTPWQGMMGMGGRQGATRARGVLKGC